MMDTGTSLAINNLKNRERIKGAVRKIISCTPMYSYAAEDTGNILDIPLHSLYFLTAKNTNRSTIVYLDPQGKGNV